MRRRRREHSLLLKASKILVSPGASVNLTLSHRRRALRSFPLARGGGIRPPAARNVDATSPPRDRRRHITSVEPGVSADENSKLGDGALHAESTLTLRLFRLAAHCNWPSRFRISPAFRSKSNSDLSASAALSLAGPLSVHLEDLRRRARKLARRAESGRGSYAA